MDGLPALDLCDIVIEVLHSTKDKTQPKHTSLQETGAVLDSKTKTNMSQEDRKLMNRAKWTAYPPTHILLKEGLSCTFLKK